MNTADLRHSIDVPNFTPLRKSGYTINTTPFNNESAAEWTTARCHRLLRALTSRVSILTRDLAHYTATGKPNDEPTRRTGLKSSDEEWNVNKKKIRQTYSSKGRRLGKGEQTGEKARTLPPNKRRKSLNPGELLIPTPVLARSRREYTEEEEVVLGNAQPILEEQPARKNKRKRARYGQDEHNSSFQLSDTLRDLKEKTSAARFMTYEGIHNGLEALLVATAPSRKEVKRKGARTLFAMALRAVPTYIAEQEDLVAEHIEATGSKSALIKRDMSMEIYDELEDFGSHGHGWKHLKTIVRSHGIQVVSQALCAGLLDDDFVGCLITLCVQLSAIDEAQTLFSSILSSIHFACPKSIYDKPHELLAMLGKFTEHTGQLSFQYRELSALFSLGLLPVDWVATRAFEHIWIGLFQTLSLHPRNVDAIILLNTLLPIMSHAVTNSHFSRNTIISEAINNTFASVLTTLVSIIILSQGSHTTETNSRPTEDAEGYQNLTSLLKSCSIPVGHDSRNISILLLLSIFFTRSTVLGDDDDAHAITYVHERLGNERSRKPKSYASAVTFTSAIARCCGRGGLSSGFEYLRHLHHLLEDCGHDIESDIFKSLIVDSAYVFADQGDDSQYAKYASEIDNKLRVTRMGREPSSAVEGKETNSGFRWEEGIGEWVTASPLAVKKNAITSWHAEYSDCDSPYRPPGKLVANCSATLLPVPSDGPLFLEGDVDEYLSSWLALDDSVDFDIGCEGSSIHKDASDSADELTTDFSFAESSVVSNISFDDADMSFERPNFPASNSESQVISTKPAVTKRSIERGPRLHKTLLSNSQTWKLFEDSSPLRGSSIESAETRQFVGKVPRLGRKVLEASKSWQIYDESDDELSFVTVTSQEDRVLSDISEASTNRSRQNRQIEQKSSRPGKIGKQTVIASSDSEDELCM